MKFIHQRYEVIKQIGEGGTSQVLLVYDHRLRINVALKKAHKEHDAYYTDTFLNEIAILAKLHHARIPHIIDRFEEDGYSCVVMEYIDGVPLPTYLEENEDISLQQVQTWLMQILAIFQYLHNLQPPLLYIDVKPQNIIRSDQDILYLIDFGASTFADQPHITSATPVFAPKEVMQEQTATIQSDIYSIGKTFYMLYHGHLPQPEDTLDPLDRILMRCMAEKPEDRYQSITQIYQALGRKREKRKHTLYRIVLYACCMSLFFTLGMRSYKKHQVHIEESYQKAMEKQQYEQAIQWKPEDRSAYAALYQQEEKKTKSCALSFTKIEQIAQKYKQEDAEEIAFLLGTSALLCEDPKIIVKADSYFTKVLKKGDVDKELLQTLRSIVPLLQVFQWEPSQGEQLSKVLARAQKNVQGIQDKKLRYGYEKLLISLYSVYHSEVKNSNDHIRILAQDANMILQQEPTLSSKEEIAFVLEKEAMAYVWMGYDAYEQHKYAEMKDAYENAIHRMKQTDMEDKYNVMSDLQLRCFVYGIYDQDKKANSYMLDIAKSYAEKIPEEDQRLYRLGVIEEEESLWR